MIPLTDRSTNNATRSRSITPSGEAIEHHVVPSWNLWRLGHAGGAARSDMNVCRSSSSVRSGYGEKAHGICSRGEHAHAPWSMVHGTAW